MKQAKRQGVTLEEVEARRLLTAQRNVAQAQLEAREIAERVNKRVREAMLAQQQAFDALATKYHLDPKQAYSLDDETLRLTPKT